MCAVPVVGLLGGLLGAAMGRLAVWAVERAVEGGVKRAVWAAKTVREEGARAVASLVKAAAVVRAGAVAGRAAVVRAAVTAATSAVVMEAGAVAVVGEAMEDICSLGAKEELPVEEVREAEERVADETGKGFAAVEEDSWEVSTVAAATAAEATVPEQPQGHISWGRG